MNRFSHVVDNLLIYIDTYYDNYHYYYDIITNNDKHINHDIDIDYEDDLKNMKVDYKKLKNQIDNYIDIFDYLN
jgi:hypothetical protein